MRFDVLTLFPEQISSYFSQSITGRALKEGIIELNTVNIRDYSNDPHNSVDDYTYGGGAGMLMMPGPVYDAYKSLNVPKDTRVVYLTPVGRVFDQKYAIDLSKEKEIVFICGHYEGIDERVIDEIVTDRISIGDYVLTGGETAALVVMDAVSRLVPGVLGNETSFVDESFYDDLLEYPQYTRPEHWMGKDVPPILLSGDHAAVDEWRLEESIRITKELRPDLYEKWAVSHEEYFIKKEKKAKREAEKARKRAKKLANTNDL
ncbi:MAG: tRNA (guanosine(37)-N1)-methyltransferase TrmD [Lachnospiraceae bacterium]|nr:tRNA (guanosine(37)-N1)-methyltransferase TrmD [Lachnospiraceae bacterium]